MGHGGVPTGGESTDDARVAAALPAWGDVRLVERVADARGGVWLARRRGERVSVRASRRATPALEWELDLLDHLAELKLPGLRVPAPIPTLDACRHEAGVVLAPWLDGRTPQAKADWDAVAEALGRVHQATDGWSQRPGFAASAELVRLRRAGDVDLDALPADVSVDCVTALAALAEHEGAARRSAVHGDPGPANLRVVGHRVALLHWDAARVDHPPLDFADLTLPPAQQPPAVVRRAALAHAVAAGWWVAPATARRRAAELRRLLS